MNQQPSLAKPSRAGPEHVERTIGTESGTHIDLKSYDWSKMPLGFSWYIFGGSGKGKTILLDNIMYHNARRFHSGFLQTPTQDVIEKFSEHMPIAYINPKHSVEQIDTVDELKKEIISKYPRGEKDDTRPMFMILDDVAYNRDFCHDQIFNKITFNGRH
jgi:predicted ATPase